MRLPVELPHARVKLNEHICKPACWLRKCGPLLWRYTSSGKLLKEFPNQSWRRNYGKKVGSFNRLSFEPNKDQYRSELTAGRGINMDVMIHAAMSIVPINSAFVSVMTLFFIIY